ncbi:MAG: hypothetical protein AB8G95_03315 [Anaerolineae bacterium]
MADKKNETVLSELQQLRGIVLGEYTIEIDRRLADLEQKMGSARTDLAGAIADANTLSSNEIQAVRDLIDDRLSALTADLNKNLESIQAQLSDLQANHVDRNQMAELLISMGNQIKVAS